ncbi:CdaR family transcriptional regulator [Oceanobacillus polygoni]|uniref:Carbohydrate diacid regulator n=1 Tax=Oceanobacillus polygoni TaxID=1235259 RepID=A0A9X0YUU4_9BACI|nr:sugar diacid recognition domain-containing protein [Oceanobacillus polygoni]MBP2079247.1 carbohydrate diacid regulator [Oceanobacillus polygoni]
MEVTIIKGFVQFAQKIVKSTSDILPFPISLIDENGYIIGSTNPDRIGTIHPPSKEALQKNTVLIYDEEKTKNMNNVLPGVVIPLTFENKAVGVLGIIGPPEQVKPYAYLVKSYVEMMWQDAIHRQTKDLRLKAAETFAQYVLLNDTHNQQTLEQYCDMLQISYSSKRFCIVIDIGNALLKNTNIQNKIGDFKAELLEATHESFQCMRDSLCTFLNSEKITLLNSVKSEEAYVDTLQSFEKQSLKLMTVLRSFQIKHTAIAIGSLSQTIADIHQSFQEANSLIQYGEVLNISPKIYSYHNWKMLLGLLPEKIHTTYKDKLGYRLLPLLQDKSAAELAKTFITYCEANMNTSKAAKKLFIHRNTLIYRLQKIEEITSLDTKSFEHCMLLYLGLRKQFS